MMKHQKKYQILNMDVFGKKCGAFSSQQLGVANNVKSEFENDVI